MPSSEMQIAEEKPWVLPGTPAKVHVTSEGESIYHLQLKMAADDSPACHADSLPSALAWWKKKKPGLRIVSITTLQTFVPKNAEYANPVNMYDSSLLIVTEEK